MTDMNDSQAMHGMLYLLCSNGYRDTRYLILYDYMYK